SPNDPTLESPIPAASLDSILCTEELRRRPWRPPDYEKENRALGALLSALLHSPSNILQTLAETILDVTRCDSSGLSLLTKDDGGKRFYWPAIAGMWKPHTGGGTPREFGPCGDVLDRDCTLLFRHFERRYPYLVPVIPAAEECLLVPFYVGGKAVGTIWAIMHDDRRKFDAEDDRLMSTLGGFASLAYQTLESIEDLKLQIAARERAERVARELATGLEAKVRRLVDANIMGIVIWNLEGEIVEANEAFLHIVGYGRDDLVSGRVRWRELTPAEWREADDRRVAELKATGIAQPYEKEYFRKGGGRVPVLVGGALFEEGGNEGVAFVLDLTERKRAEDALHEVRAVVAHVTRVTTMGELAASIAHEVNQPLAAVITNCNAGLRWLADKPPNLDEAGECLRRIMRDGNRAGEVVTRIRSLVKRSGPVRERHDLNESVREMVLIANGEARRYGVVVRTELAPLPPVRGDRVQLQQVILNLVINGIESMKDVMDRPRELLISSRPVEASQVLLAVKDGGVGLDGQSMERVFEPFYTTKPEGMGMGLSISRSIVEAHEGRLWAEANSGYGATFQLTLPIESPTLVEAHE
ncbi:MAG TPA: ATP-binding protein, partial [Gemmataceae bacterium]|nr:ATP-binding protein [Gemmataceae bacterium]